MAKNFDLDDLKDVDVKGLVKGLNEGVDKLDDAMDKMGVDVNLDKVDKALDKAEELVEKLDTDKLDDVLGMFKKDK